jgi:hypothetical protein
LSKVDPRLEQAQLNTELAAIAARYNDGGPTAADVQSDDDVQRCNGLERHRLRYFPLDSRPRRALAEWSRSHPPPREPVTYPIDYGDGSWRERCDAGLAGDSGTAADDDW